MRPLHLDLGLSEADERAMQDTRRKALAVDREAALRFIADVSPLVAAAVRGRPLLSGAPFTLPGHRELSVS